MSRAIAKINKFLLLDLFALRTLDCSLKIGNVLSDECFSFFLFFVSLVRCFGKLCLHVRLLYRILISFDLHAALCSIKYTTSPIRIFFPDESNGVLAIRSMVTLTPYSQFNCRSFSKLQKLLLFKNDATALCSIRLRAFHMRYQQF